MVAVEMASHADCTCASAMLKICPPKERLKVEDFMDFWDDSRRGYGLI